MPITASVFLVYVFISALTFPAWGAGVVREWFPGGIVEYLEAREISGRIFNLLDYGGSVGWMLSDRDNPQVFIDGRQQAQNEGWNVYNHILSGSYVWNYCLQRYDVNIVVTSATFVTGKLIPVAVALADYRGWHLVYSDQRAMLFCVRKPSRPARQKIE